LRQPLFIFPGVPIESALAPWQIKPTHFSERPWRESRLKAEVFENKKATREYGYLNKQALFLLGFPTLSPEMIIGKKYQKCN
jgi:hypothetical protein